MSPASPGLIAGDEVIVRMVCAPQHVHDKRPELLTSFFSHAFTRGLSAQRMQYATDLELKNTIEAVAGGAGKMWLGYIEFRASEIRELVAGERAGQHFCVYDAALPPPNSAPANPPEPVNPAHAEIHAARRIPETEQMEYRVALKDFFKAKGILRRRSLREGAVWATLADDIKQRSLPAQWAALV